MRYLMATDGSAPSLKAARFMLRHVRPGTEDEIFVAYVFPLPSDPECYEGVAVLPTSAGDDRVAAVAAPILQATMDILLESGSNVRDVCLVGNPAQEIVEFAMNLGIDLVVLITTLEFVDDPRAALAESWRVARRGIVLGVLNRRSRLGRELERRRDPPWPQATLYTVRELRRLVLDAAGERRPRIMVKTTLWPRWRGALRLPWGGFIGVRATAR